MALQFVDVLDSSNQKYNGTYVDLALDAINTGTGTADYVLSDGSVAMDASVDIASIDLDAQNITTKNYVDTKINARIINGATVSTTDALSALEVDSRIASGVAPYILKDGSLPMDVTYDLTYIEAMGTNKAIATLE